MGSGVVGVVWTFNPDTRRLARVLESVLGQVGGVVVVDNGSSNIGDVRRVCGRFNGVELLELGVNLGVGALNIGLRYVVERYDPEFVLLLDDDTVLHPGAVQRVLEKARRSRLYDRIGALCISVDEPSESWRGRLVVVPRSIFSGCMIRSRVVREGVRVRSEFFLDQADHDFYAEIRRRGYLVVVYGEKLADHRLGVKLRLGKRIRLPVLGASEKYEPPWRYYYIARNSTILLLEGKIEPKFYIRQLWAFFMPLIMVDGVTKTFKALFMGLAHGVLRRLGYLDPVEAGLLASLSSDRMRRKER